jgi:hypothetical protein
MIGTVTNPSAFVDRSGRRVVNVRWDMQQPYETGNGINEDELVAETDGENEFHLRRYCLRYLSHDRIAMLHRVLGHSADPEAAEFIKHLPRLPS